MSYVKQDWQKMQTEATPLEASNFEQIETGIADVTDRVDAGLGQVKVDTSTTYSDLIIKKGTTLVDKVPLEANKDYEIVVSTTSGDTSYTARLVDGGTLGEGFSALAGYQVLYYAEPTADTTSSAKIVCIIQDGNLKEGADSVIPADGKSTLVSDFDSVKVINAYISNTKDYKLIGQSTDFIKAAQTDFNCTDENSIKFLKNNPISKDIKTQKTIVKYNLINLTDKIDCILDSLGNGVSDGFCKISTTDFKLSLNKSIVLQTIDPDPQYSSVEVLTESNAQTEFGQDFPASVKIFMGANQPIIIQGFSYLHYDPNNQEKPFDYKGLVDEQGNQKVDESGNFIPDNNSLYIFTYNVSDLFTLVNPIPDMFLLNQDPEETLLIEKTNILDPDKVKGLQADFSESDPSKAGFIVNAPVYKRLKTLPGLVVEGIDATSNSYYNTIKNDQVIKLTPTGSYESIIISIDPLTKSLVYDSGNDYIQLAYLSKETFLANFTKVSFEVSAEVTEEYLRANLPDETEILAIYDEYQNEVSYIPVLFTHTTFDVNTNKIAAASPEHFNDYTLINGAAFNANELFVIAGPGVPNSHYKYSETKKLASDLIQMQPADSFNANSNELLSCSTLWNWISGYNFNTQVLSSSDGHIRFNKTSSVDNSHLELNIESYGIGQNSKLKTAAKDTIVDAINENKSAINGIKKSSFLTGLHFYPARSGNNYVSYLDASGEEHNITVSNNYYTATEAPEVYTALLNNTIIWSAKVNNSDGGYFGFSRDSYTVYRLDKNDKIYLYSTVANTSVIDDFFTEDNVIYPSMNACQYMESNDRYIKRPFKDWTLEGSYGPYEVGGVLLELYSKNGILRISGSRAWISSAYISLTNASTLSPTGKAMDMLTDYDTSTHESFDGICHYRTETTSYYKSMCPIFIDPKNTGIAYYFCENTDHFIGDKTYSNLQIIRPEEYRLCWRALNAEGTEIITLNDAKTPIAGTENNIHSPYVTIYDRGDYAYGHQFACLSSSKEILYREYTTVSGKDCFKDTKKPIQTDTDLFTNLDKAKLCFFKGILYVFSNKALYSLDISSDAPKVTKLISNLTIADNGFLTTFGDNIISFSTDTRTAQVIQFRKSFDLNKELNFDFNTLAQSKLVLKDTKTNALFNLTVSNGKLEITPVNPPDPAPVTPAAPANSTK